MLTEPSQIRGFVPLKPKLTRMLEFISVYFSVSFADKEGVMRRAERAMRYIRIGSSFLLWSERIILVLFDGLVKTFYIYSRQYWQIKIYIFKSQIKSPGPIKTEAPNLGCRPAAYLSPFTQNYKRMYWMRSKRVCSMGRNRNRWWIDRKRLNNA